MSEEQVSAAENTDAEVEAVDDDGHTVEDITPWPIEEDDDDETAQNGDADDPEEYLNWDRDKHGTMDEYATESEEDEPECQAGDDVEVGE